MNRGDGLQTFMDGVLLLFLSAAVWMDLCSYKVSNGIAVAAAASGLLLNFGCFGREGFLDALAGSLLLFGILFPLYCFSMLGAGDVKLFMAAGAFTGIRGSLFSLAASFLIGASFSVTVMIKHQNFFKRLSYLYFYFLQIKSKHGIKPYYPLKYPVQGETIHFTLCIALAVCLYIGLWRG